MAELFSITKAVKSVVSPLSWFKALMIGMKIFGIVALGWFIYVGAIKPHINPTPTESQTAENITNYNYTLAPKQTFFGCSRFDIEKPTTNRE